MFYTKMSGKVEKMREDAKSRMDARGLIDISNSEFEGWKQGFKSGISISLVGLSTGYFIAWLILKIRNKTRA